MKIVTQLHHKDKPAPFQASFVKSAVKPANFPLSDRPEAAFAGRSNVGKSSILNCLLSRRKLARTSSTPGRTQTINFFDIGGKLYFADLPGFGYAKVPLAVRAAWGPMVEGYLSAGRDIRLVILLVDVRRDPGEEEIALLNWLDSYQIPGLVVVTKADKVKRSKLVARQTAIREALNLPENPVLFSSLTGLGRSEVWSRLALACDITLSR